MIGIDLELYLERSALPNNLIYFAEVLDAIAMLDKVNIDIEKANFENEIIKISDELLIVGQWFLTTSDGLFDLILQEMDSKSSTGDMELIEFESLLNFKEIGIPWFSKVK